MNWHTRGMTTQWTGSINITYNNQNVAVFTAGAPGSGKTYTINRLFGLDQFTVLDLDLAMKNHPEFNIDDPKTMYKSSKVGKDSKAYIWADEVVEENFQRYLKDGSGGGGDVRILVDGTGTRVARQKRRMREAKEAGEGWKERREEERREKSGARKSGARKSGARKSGLRKSGLLHSPLLLPLPFVTTHTTTQDSESCACTLKLA